jgi:hypothetical protein
VARPRTWVKAARRGARRIARPFAHADRSQPLAREAALRPAARPFSGPVVTHPVGPERRAR